MARVKVQIEWPDNLQALRVEPQWRAWSTFGPHAIRAERFPAVTNGMSLPRPHMPSCKNNPGAEP
jgi:hypothetical protein